MAVGQVLFDSVPEQFVHYCLYFSASGILTIFQPEMLLPYA